MSKDLFSRQSDTYALYRPVYPGALFEYILSFVKERKLAWDCATGNGQAAVALAEYFDKVMATDSSEKQIQNAVFHPRIEYAVGRAEMSGFAGQSFDLITVAQAYHWLNAVEFTAEVRRVLKPGGVIAIWGYNIPVSKNENLDELILRFYQETVGPYWDKERKFIDESYKTVAFDFDELPAREFSIEVNWDLQHFIGYLNSWSAVQHYIDANGVNPVELFLADFKDKWPGGEKLNFRFPVFLRLGTVN
jgi:ubiquinone/menaquinone biosynthesis C-methylase UbiE